MSNLVYNHENFVPESIVADLNAYVKEGTISNSFLLACLENNLMGAISQADANNLKCLVSIMRYIYWEMPGNCWGSKDKVAAWLNT